MLENLNGFIFKRNTNKQPSPFTKLATNTQLLGNNGFVFKISDNSKEPRKNRSTSTAVNTNKTKKQASNTADSKIKNKRAKSNNIKQKCNKENFQNQIVDARISENNDCIISAKKRIKLVSKDFIGNSNAPLHINIATNKDVSTVGVEDQHLIIDDDLNQIEFMKNKLENEKSCHDTINNNLLENNTKINNENGNIPLKHDTIINALQIYKIPENNLSIVQFNDKNEMSLIKQDLKTIVLPENNINMEPESCPMPTYKKIDITDACNKLNAKRSISIKNVVNSEKKILTSTAKTYKIKTPKKQENIELSLKEPTFFSFKKEQFNLKMPKIINIPADLSIEEKIKLQLNEIIADSFLSIELADIIKNYKYVDPYETLINDYKILINEYQTECEEYENELMKWETARNDIWNENILTVLDNECEYNLSEKYNLKDKIKEFDNEMDNYYVMLEFKKDKMKMELNEKNERMRKMMKSVFEILKRDSLMDPVLLLKMMSKM